MSEARECHGTQLWAAVPELTPEEVRLGAGFLEADAGYFTLSPLASVLTHPSSAGLEHGQSPKVLAERLVQSPAKRE
jgi:hypothetical protein